MAIGQSLLLINELLMGCMHDANECSEVLALRQCSGCQPSVKTLDTYSVCAGVRQCSQGWIQDLKKGGANVQL